MLPPARRVAAAVAAGCTVALLAAPSASPTAAEFDLWSGRWSLELDGVTTKGVFLPLGDEVRGNFTGLKLLGVERDLSLVGTARSSLAG